MLWAVGVQGGCLALAQPPGGVMDGPREQQRGWKSWGPCGFVAFLALQELVKLLRRSLLYPLVLIFLPQLADPALIKNRANLYL